MRIGRGVRKVAKSARICFCRAALLRDSTHTHARTHTYTRNQSRVVTLPTAPAQSQTYGGCGALRSECGVLRRQSEEAHGEGKDGDHHHQRADQQRLRPRVTTPDLVNLLSKVPQACQSAMMAAMRTAHTMHPSGNSLCASRHPQHQKTDAAQSSARQRQRAVKAHLQAAQSNTDTENAIQRGHKEEQCNTGQDKVVHREFLHSTQHSTACSTAQYSTAQHNDNAHTSALAAVLPAISGGVLGR